MFSCAPSAQLRPFASMLWWSVTSAPGPAVREHVLLTGQMHLVFRLAGPPLRIYRDHVDLQGTLIREPVIGGVRAGYYAKEAGVCVRSVGVQLLPGAAMALFGAPAGQFAGAHTGLSAVWGADAERMLQQIGESGTPNEQLRMLDRLLCARLQANAALHPQIALALRELDSAGPIATLVSASHYSHRGFISLFRDATGVSPKRYARIQRFQQVLAGLRASPSLPLGELALANGYSDQSHMTREFREFAGLSPGEYRLLAPAAANHVTKK